jgi:hypothetical protein
MANCPVSALQRFPRHIFDLIILFNSLHVPWSVMPFTKFLDLPSELRGRVYELHFLENFRVVNLGFRGQLSRSSQMGAQSSSPIELLSVPRDVSFIVERYLNVAVHKDSPPRPLCLTRLCGLRPGRNDLRFLSNYDAAHSLGGTKVVCQAFYSWTCLERSTTSVIANCYAISGNEGSSRR